MYKYDMIISWSERDNIYLVSVPELPGCVADGATPSEALANAEVIIKEWIEFAQQCGRQVPSPKGTAVFA